MKLETLLYQEMEYSLFNNPFLLRKVLLGNLETQACHNWGLIIEFYSDYSSWQFLKISSCLFTWSYNEWILNFSSSEKVCGTGYIYVYISNAEQDILEFDQIKFSKRCTDKPGLSLGVSKNSNTVKSSLKQGMLNPFRAIGIDDIQVVNAPRNCSDCEHTDLQVQFFLKIQVLLRYTNLAKIG